MFDTDYRLVSGIAIIYHQYFSFLTLLMFNSIDLSLPPSPRLCPHFAPYIENPAAVYDFGIYVCYMFNKITYLLTYLLTYLQHRHCSHIVKL